MVNKYSILIVDDHPPIVEGYKNALVYGFSTVSEAKLSVDFAYSFKNTIEKVQAASKSKGYDLIILDLSIPSCEKHKMYTGEGLGLWIKSIMPKKKFLIATSFDETIRINNAFKKLKPEGFFIKSELTAMELVMAVNRILNNSSHYGQKVTQVLKNRCFSDFELKSVDFQILKEMSNGTKSKDISRYVPLSKSGVEKRVRFMKQHFNVVDNENRTLILTAKKMGYI